MSKKINMNKVLLMALSEPEYARVDYWIAEQENSSYRKETFIKKLLDAHKHYEYEISKKEAEFKVYNPAGTVSNPQIPLFYETDGELTGHLGSKLLTELGGSIVELYKFWYPEKQNTESKKINIQPIHWLNEGSLRLFIEELKSAGLIENRETEDIIQEHFRVEDKLPTKESKPIKWLINIKFLAYLIDRLGEEFIINIKGSKHKLTANHFVNSDGNDLNTSSLSSFLSQIKKHGRSTDKNISSIENIIQRIKS